MLTDCGLVQSPDHIPYSLEVYLGALQTPARFHCCDWLHSSFFRAHSYFFYYCGFWEKTNNSPASISIKQTFVFLPKEIKGEKMHSRYPFSQSENCSVIPGAQCRRKQILEKAKDEHTNCTICSQHLPSNTTSNLTFLYSYSKDGIRKAHNKRLRAHRKAPYFTWHQPTRLAHSLPVSAQVSPSQSPSLSTVFKIATHLVACIFYQHLPSLFIFLRSTPCLLTPYIINSLLLGLFLVFPAPDFPCPSWAIHGQIISSVHGCVPGPGMILPHSRCWIYSLKGWIVIQWFKDWISSI